MSTTAKTFTDLAVAVFVGFWLVAGMGLVLVADETLSAPGGATPALQTNLVVVPAGISPTNLFFTPVITNLVMEGGKLCAQTDDPRYVIAFSNEARTNALDALIALGEFCRVRGHVWGEHLHVTLEYTPGKLGCRACGLCGKHETRFAEWK